MIPEISKTFVERIPVLADYSRNGVGTLKRQSTILSRSISPFKVSMTFAYRKPVGAP
jgi:hypothetical protein